MRVWWLVAAVMVAAAALVARRIGDWMNRQPERLPTSNERPTVLIAGSGFGGFHAARELERRLPAEAADIVLASPDNHLTYGPLLPNVAAGVIEPRHVAVALHGELRRTRYLTGALTALDIPGRTATLCDADGDATSVHWDRLVLAPGAVTRLPAILGLAEHALGLKTMTAAITLRDHVIRQLNLADATDDPAERRARATFVVVGAGYTGVEAAAHLQLFSQRAVRRFSRLRRSDLRWVLVDVADQVLADVGPVLGRRALAVLRRRGLQVRLRTTVEEVTEDAVRLSDGETLPSYTLVWAAGVKPEPVVERLGLPLEKGRLRVEATLRVPGVDGVYALGDAAAVPDLTQPGRFTAPTAQHAQRQGRAVARNVAASLGYGTERPYRHHDLGQAVDLGPFSAVARPLGLPLWGLPAALVTRGYHLLALPSAAGRVRVLLGWLLDLVMPPQLSRVGRTSPVGAAEPGRGGGFPGPRR